jgi:hypothetical protein
MRANIYYNPDGSINSIIAGNQPASGKADVGAGERNIEIQIPDIAPDIDSGDLSKRLIDIAENQIVDIASAGPQLRKR